MNSLVDKYLQDSPASAALPPIKPLEAQPAAPANIDPGLKPVELAPAPTQMPMPQIEQKLPDLQPVAPALEPARITPPPGIDIVAKYLGTPAPEAALGALPAIPETPPLTSIPITQTFGQPSQYDVFSGNINTGVDFAVPTGTPLKAPKGTWGVIETYDAADNNGYIGNNINRGYGNSVVMQNMDTGEKIRISHLSKVGVKPGQILDNDAIGLSGSSGNVTASHVDAEYYDQNGKLSDILQSPYSEQIFQ